MLCGGVLCAGGLMSVALCVVACTQWQCWGLLGVLCPLQWMVVNAYAAQPED